MKINIIGSGNVAHHLYTALGDSVDVEVKLINSRTLSNLDYDADIILIAVADSAIKEVAVRITEKIPGFKGIMAHTAGSVNIDVFPPSVKRRGVFYPLQTFSKGKTLDYSRIPFFIESADAKDTETLKDLALKISPNVYEATSETRKKLHLASVFACNFTNHLYALADEILNEEGLDFSVLLPLLSETTEKLDTLTPAEAQTGPARRGDIDVLKSHLTLLKDSPLAGEIYRLLSLSILEKYHPGMPDFS